MIPGEFRFTTEREIAVREEVEAKYDRLVEAAELVLGEAGDEDDHLWRRLREDHRCLIPKGRIDALRAALREIGGEE